MKHLFVISLAVLSIAACKTSDKKTDQPVADTASKLTPDQIQQAGNDTANFTTIQWLDSTTRDLGKLKAGESIDVTFRFKNAGNKPLIIKNVSASCGCTVPEQHTKPYAPGEEGIIKATFNGSGHDAITKQVTVDANTTPNTIHTLIFTGTIVEKK